MGYARRNGMEFLEVVLQERLDAVLSERDTALPKKAQVAMEAAETVLGKLDKQDRAALNAQQDLFGERAADHERCAYVEGFCDGMSVLFAFWLYVGKDIYERSLLKERGEESGFRKTSGSCDSRTGG